MTIADIVLETRSVVDATSDSLSDATLLRRINAAYEEIVGKIIGVDGSWQFDDTNYTDHPIGTTTLVDGQKDYSFDITQLDIERVEVLDANGLGYLLKPIDKSQIGVALSEFYKVNGLPVYYDKNGSSVFLYPTPAAGSVTLVAGLKVYFQRTAAVFTSGEVSTGTKVPGFASPFHILIAYKASLPYALSYKKDRVALILNEITRLEDGLLTFYAKREKDTRKVMTSAHIAHR